MVTDVWDSAQFMPDSFERFMPALALFLRSVVADPALASAHITDAGFLNEFFAASTRTTASFIDFYMEQTRRDRLVLSYN